MLTRSMEQEDDTPLTSSRALGVCSRKMADVIAELAPDISEAWRREIGMACRQLAAKTWHPAEPEARQAALTQRGLDGAFRRRSAMVGRG